MRTVGHGRDRILAEARRLFVAEDFADVSMQRIAAAAGLTKAALYYHFSDKVALYEAAVRAELGRARDAILAAAAWDGPLEERLRRVALAVYGTFDGDLMRLTEDLHRRVSAERHHELHTEMEEAFAAITAVFDRPATGDPSLALDAALAGSLYFHLIASLIDPAQLGDERLIRVAPRHSTDKAVLVARLFVRGYAGLAAAHDRHVAQVTTPTTRRRPSPRGRPEGA